MNLGSLPSNLAPLDRGYGGSCSVASQYFAHPAGLPGVHGRYPLGYAPAGQADQRGSPTAGLPLALLAFGGLVALAWLSRPEPSRR